MEIVFGLFVALVGTVIIILGGAVFLALCWGVAVSVGTLLAIMFGEAEEN